MERPREVIDIGLARLLAAAATIDFTKVDGCEELIETALDGALQHDDIAVISAQLVVLTFLAQVARTGVRRSAASISEIEAVATATTVSAAP